MSGIVVNYKQNIFLFQKQKLVPLMFGNRQVHCNKGRIPYNGRLSNFSFYIDSQISVHRKFKK